MIPWHTLRSHFTHFSCIDIASCILLTIVILCQSLPSTYIYSHNLYSYLLHYKDCYTFAIHYTVYNLFPKRLPNWDFWWVARPRGELLQFATKSVTKQTLTCKIKILEACHSGMSMHAQSCSSSRTLEQQYIPIPESAPPASLLTDFVERVDG